MGAYIIKYLIKSKYFLIVMNVYIYCAHYDIIICVSSNRPWPTLLLLILPRKYAEFKNAQIKLLIDFMRGYSGINWDRCDAGQKHAKNTNTIH